MEIQIIMQKYFQKSILLIFILKNPTWTDIGFIYSFVENNNSVR